jgi:hypothetical protein
MAFTDGQILTAAQLNALASSTTPIAANIGALRDLDSTLYTTAYTKGYYTTNDGGQATYRYDASDVVSADDSGSVIVGADGARWKLQHSGIINAKWFGVIGDGVIDNAAAMQTALNFCVNKGITLLIPTGTYRVNAALNITGSLKIRGEGEISHDHWIANCKGPWFLFNHTDKGFNITASEVEFNNIATHRVHTETLTAWAPTVADYDFYFSNCYDITFKDIFVHGSYKGFCGFHGGRWNFYDIRGSFFFEGFNLDEAYDVCRMNNIQVWPFWLDATEVATYTKANLKSITTKRVDNPQLSNIFSIYHYAALTLDQSASGKTSKVHGSNLDFDVGKYGIFVTSSAVGTTGQFENLSIQGDATISGCIGIRVDGSNSSFQFGNTDISICDYNGIRVINTGNELRFNSSLRVSNYDISAGGWPAVEALSGNKVYVASVPKISTTYGTAKNHFGGAGSILLGNGQTASYYGAVGDGTTDCRNSLFRADARGETILTPGTYKISSNITFTNRLIFQSGAKISIDTGVTVTFSKEIDAPVNEQIFYGLGTVTGLSTIYAMWFAGDGVDNSLADSQPELQKAYDACETSGTVYFPSGKTFYINGTTAISVSRSQRTVGSGKNNSFLRCTSTATNCFDISGASSAGIRGLSIGKTGIALASSGSAVKITSSMVVLDDFIVIRAWNALDIVGGAQSKVSNFEILDSMNIGVYLQGASRVFFDNFTISASADIFTIVPISGTFAANDVLTGGSSGATTFGTIEINSTTQLRAVVSNINFVAGETITGSVSGATATLTSQIVPHLLGGIRAIDSSEKIVFSNGEVVGGKYGMTTDASSYTVGNRPAYIKLSDVYFHDSDLGCSYNNSVEFDFSSCKFSNKPEHGLTLNTTDNFKFNGGGAIGCWKHGVVITANTEHVTFSGFSASGNSTEAANTYNGFDIAANTVDFQLVGIRAGGSLSLGSQKYGVLVNAGSSDRYTITGDVTENTTAGILDSGTGLDKVINARGYTSRNKGTSAVAVGTSSIAVTHGLNLTPTAKDILITPTVSLSGSGISSWWVSAVSSTTFTISVNTNVTSVDFTFGWTVNAGGL